MKVESFKHKKCYLFPYSNMSEVFKKYLEENNIIVKGFIDNNKKEVLKLSDITNKEFDYIFILSPNHEKIIYEEVIKRIDKSKIICVRLNQKNKEYDFVDNKKAILQNNDNSNHLIEEYFYEKSKKYELENEILLIGIDFIDLNIKYLYLYLLKNSSYKIHLASNNQRDIEIYKSYGINVILYNSKKFIDLVFKTKIKIVDHTPVNKILVESLKVGKSIQLWHGITIETLGVLANYKILEYDIVLSTSPFVSDYSFSKIYDYKKIIHSGYPRNDILYNDNIKLINVDELLLKEMQDDEFKYIVYMPTHRPLGFNKNPLDYIILNEFAKTNKLKFIIKMHPFVAEKLRDDLTSYQNRDYDYTNIILYESHMDIYPILKYSHMLISDYSSVYFDYLYANKPIVFFCYDYDEWVKGEQGIILDYFSHSPGDKCTTLNELLKCVLANLKNDIYENERKNLFNKMFTNQNNFSSKEILTEIKDLLND